MAFVMAGDVSCGASANDFAAGGSADLMVNVVGRMLQHDGGLGRVLHQRPAASELFGR